MEPYEMLVTPGEIWLAAYGSGFPDVDVTPSSPWALLGQSGDENLSEDGITITHEQTLNQFRALGVTGPLKVSRSEENLMIAGILEDLSLEEYTKVLHNVSVATGTTDGGADYKEIDLRLGLDVAVFAFLLRLPVSAYGDGFASQYQVPRVYQSENPTPVFSKDGKAGLAFQFTALEDTDAATEAERFGQLIMQTSS